MREICEKHGLEISEETKGRGKTFTPDEYKIIRDDAKEELKADPDILEEIKDEIRADVEDELLSEQQHLVDEISSQKQEISELLADADKQIAHKESRLAELSGKENEIKQRIKSIEESGQILTLKQIERISPKVHAPIVGHRGIILAEDEYSNLKSTAMVAAKANEEAKRWKSVAGTAHEAIRDIVRAVKLIKYKFMEANHPLADNLTIEQKLLINSIHSHGEAIAKRFGYKKLAEDMRAAGIGGAISEIFTTLLTDERKKNQKAAPSFLEEAVIKAQEKNSKITRSSRRKNDSPEM